MLTAVPGKSEEHITTASLPCALIGRIASKQPSCYMSSRGWICRLQHFRSQTGQYSACVCITLLHVLLFVGRFGLKSKAVGRGIWCGTGWQKLPEGSEEVVTRKVWEESWWARRRACSPMGTALMCSFWISSMLPIVRPDSLAMARLSGKLALLKLVIRFTCNPALLSAGCTYR